MRTILFDSAELPGDARLRKERWVDSLSSAYVRLRADVRPDLPFDGRLKVMQIGAATIGTISGTVLAITRTPTEIAAQNTDNAVLLINSGADQMLVEQKSGAVNCERGEAVLIEQCEPSSIKMRAQCHCDFVAVQLPRHELGRYSRKFADRFMKQVPAGVAALSLLRAYARTLFACADAELDVPLFAADHIADLVAAACNTQTTPGEMQERGQRAARFAVILRELDRGFMQPDFSLTTLAQRLAISPRYVQVLFCEAATSFTHEVIKRRLARARHMLTAQACTHLSVTDIAYECGFSTISHFHRVFRRHFGVTPGEMREAALQQGKGHG